MRPASHQHLGMFHSCHGSHTSDERCCLQVQASKASGVLAAVLAAWNDAAVVDAGSLRLAELAAAGKARKLLGDSLDCWRNLCALRRQQMQLLSRAVSLHARRLLATTFCSLQEASQAARYILKCCCCSAVPGCHGTEGRHDAAMRKPQKHSLPGHNTRHALSNSKVCLPCRAAGWPTRRQRRDMRGARGAAASQRCRRGRRARRRSRGTGLPCSASARGRLPAGAQQR